jgi:hypothetical protein
MVMRVDYFSLEDKYRDCGTADADTIITSVSSSSRQKTVENFGGGGGEKLASVEQSIEAVAEQIVWERLSPPTIGEKHKNNLD